MESWLDARFIGDTSETYASCSAVSAETKAGLEAHLRAVEATMTPAPKEAITIALARLAAHFWNDRNEVQWKIMFEDYARDFQDIPADILGESLTLYRKRGKFWPKVSEILEIANPMVLKRKRILARLRKLCDVKPDGGDSRNRVVPAVRRFPSKNGESWGEESAA